MRRHQILWEAHVRRFLDALDRHKQGRLTAEEAGELLGLSGRHFRRQSIPAPMMAMWGFRNAIRILRRARWCSVSA